MVQIKQVKSSQDVYWLKHTHVYLQTQWQHIQT